MSTACRATTKTRRKAGCRLSRSRRSTSRAIRMWEKVVRKLRASSDAAKRKGAAGRQHYDAVIASLETSLDRGRGEPEPRPNGDDPAAHANRIPERHPRSARARRRRRLAAARRRRQLRLRQCDRRRSVADAARSLRLGRGENQPAGGRTRRPFARRRYDHDPPDLTQEDHADGLPIGTRGGAVVRTRFRSTASMRSRFD